jgi:hypothetical protein
MNLVGKVLIAVFTLLAILSGLFLTLFRLGYI